MIDPKIYTFLAVCSCMNLTKASEILHITQPAVTQHIKYLEKHYNTQLFIHEGKKLYLSESGKILLRAATTLKNDEMHIEELIHSSETHTKHLKFGTTMTIGEFVIEKPLEKYIKNHPDTNIQMVISNTSDLLSQLNNGTINFAILEGYFNSDEYAFLPYSTEKFIPVCSCNHVFKNTPASLYDLLNERIIVREPGSGTRDILEKYLTAHNLNITDFQHIVEISGMHTIINLVKDDCGITFLYEAAVKDFLKTGSLIEIALNDFNVSHDFTFIWSKGSIYEDDYKSIFKEFMS